MAGRKNRSSSSAFANAKKADIYTNFTESNDDFMIISLGDLDAGEYVLNYSSKLVI